MKLGGTTPLYECSEAAAVDNVATAPPPILLSIEDYCLSLNDWRLGASFCIMRDDYGTMTELFSAGSLV
jgi:hypothetical protein